MRERGALDRREMITRAPLIIPPNGAIFLPAAQPSGVGTEKGGRRERSFVWLESGIAQIQFHRRERDPVVRRLVRPSTSIFTGASMHFNGVLIWQMHSAHFGPRASLSLYLFLSFYPLPILPCVRR